MATTKLFGHLADSDAEEQDSREITDGQNTSILRVAYLLAAADGEVKASEREMFKKSLAQVVGLKMGAPETTELIETVVADADKLLMLRDFYDEDALVQAFLVKVAADLFAIQGAKVACRRAFAVWTSICMSDGEFSPFERRLVRELQHSCNGVRGLEVLGPAVGSIAGCALGALAGALVAKQYEKARRAKKDASGYGPEARIPDAYLKEVEERCQEINVVQAQVEACTDADGRKALEESMACLVESFRDFVENV